MPQPRGSSSVPERRARRRVGSSSRCASPSLALCLAVGLCLGLGCAHEPPPSPRAPLATPRPAPRVDAGRELASCGGSGPDTLVVTLSRIPEEADLRRAICDWFSDEPWHVRLRTVGSAL